MHVKEPPPPCRCTGNDDGTQILLFNFIINFAATGVMLLAFLEKIKKVIGEKNYTQLEQYEP